jgi:hypothetical protein
MVAQPRWPAIVAAPNWSSLTALVLPLVADQPIPVVVQDLDLIVVTQSRDLET